MTKKISRKAPLFMAACMAFALALAGCGGSGSPADRGIVNGGGNGGGGGGNGPGQQQPPANKFTFGEVTGQLNAALFSEGTGGFEFLLSTATTPGPNTMNILFTIPAQLMGDPIPLHKGYNPDQPAWSWAILFHEGQDHFFWYAGRGFTSPAEGTMQVTTSTTGDRFSIEVEGTLGVGGEEFSLHFYGDFTYSAQSVWDIPELDY